MVYSPFFHVLYDQREPVGDFGRGTHYSVLRAPVWQDAQLKPLKQAQLLDFAVIWDEDHDDRVMQVVEELFFQGLLAPACFIGERKGSLSILLDMKTLKAWNEAEWRGYCGKVDAIAQGLEDPWTAKVDGVYGYNNNIIHAPVGDVTAYLKSIDVLWKLGLKPLSEHVNFGVLEMAIEQEAAQGWRSGRVGEGEDDGEIPF